LVTGVTNRRHRSSNLAQVLTEYSMPGKHLRYPEE
jgi:hypothetical protein